MVWAHGSDAPLATRYEALVAKVCAAGGAAAVPMSEDAVLRMQAWLDRHPKKSASEPLSPSLQAATEAFRDAVRQYEDVCSAVIEDQKVLRRASRETHRVLGILQPWMFDRPPAPEVMQANLLGGLPVRYIMAAGWYVPQFSSAEQGRRAAAAVLNETIQLQATRQAIGEAISFERNTLDHQNRALIFALAARIGALEDRTLALEERNQELEQATLKKPAATAKRRKKA